MSDVPDDWLESAYEDRYVSDIDEWETEQVFQDMAHKYGDDPFDEADYDEAGPFDD